MCDQDFANIDSLLETIVEESSGEDFRVREVRVGPFLTGVWLEGLPAGSGAGSFGCGIASTIAYHVSGEDHRFQESGNLETYSARQLARFLFSEEPIKASIGMATLNAMVKVPPHCLEGPSAIDLILDLGKGGRIAVCGRFPFVETLRGEASELHVFELRPAGNELPFSMAKRIVPDSDVVVLTATVLMNGTYREILPLCRAPFTVMLGPSTPASRFLFHYGIDVLAGTVVLEPEKVMKDVSQGATYRDLKGVRKWIWEKNSKQGV